MPSSAEFEKLWWLRRSDNYTLTMIMDDTFLMNELDDEEVVGDEEELGEEEETEESM